MELRLTRWEEFKAKYKQRLTQVLAQHLYAKAFEEWKARNPLRSGTTREILHELNQGEEADLLYFERDQYREQTLVAFAECLPGAGAVLDAFKAFTGLDAAGNKVSGSERFLAGLATGLSLLGLGAVDGPADNVVAMQIKKLDEVTDGVNDASRGLRRAAGAAGDVLDGAAGAKPGDGGCFKPGTVVHRMASDPQAVLALLAEELSTEEHDESLIWWILTGIAAVTVALAVANERRRHTGNKHNVSHALATAKIDELFSSNGLWEPQSWKEAEPESELAVAL
jgi:hypothetical protein